MNPFTPDFLKPTPKFVSSTPRMSVAPKVNPNLQQSQLGDTAATARARFQATQPKSQPTGFQAPKSTTQPKTTKKTQAKPEKSAEQKYQEEVQRQINEAYKTQLGFLAEREQTLQAQLPETLAQVASPFEQQVPLLQQQLQEQQALGSEQTESLKQQEQQALAQSRRSAQEQGLRAVQQFGGVAGSSTAQAAGELIGREALRQQGAIQTQRAQGIQNIQNQLRTIQSEFDANLARLQLQKEQAVSQARLDFQRTLDTIKQARAEVGVTKASQTLQALQEFASRRRSLEDQVTQQQNNLNLLREQSILNAQNAALTQSVTPQAPINIAFSKITNPAERQKAFQAIINQTGNNPDQLALYGLRYVGKNPVGQQDLYATSEGQIIDINGNLLQ